MSDIASSSLATAAVVSAYPHAAAQGPVEQPPAQSESTRVKINAPFYISPDISFDPVTSIVFVTFRNSETGEVREQIPPVQVLSRYREASLTGLPDPMLPPRTPDQIAADTRSPRAVSSPDTPPVAPAAPAPSTEVSSAPATPPTPSASTIA